MHWAAIERDVPRFRKHLNVMLEAKEGILEIFRTSPVVVQHNEVHPNDLTKTFYRAIPFREVRSG